MNFPKLWKSEFNASTKTKDPHLEVVCQAIGAVTILLTFCKVPAQTAAQTITYFSKVQSQTVIQVTRGVADHTRSCEMMRRFNYVKYRKTQGENQEEFM